MNEKKINLTLPVI